MILASENNAPTSNLPIYRYPAVYTPRYARDLFVWIYFKKSRHYHFSHLVGVTLALVRSARVARVLPIAKHPERKQSPGTTRPAPSRILPPHTNRHHFFKTMTWNSSNQNGIDPRIFLKCTRFNLSHLALIFSIKKWLKSLFEPRFECLFLRREIIRTGVRMPVSREKTIRTSFPRADSSRQVFYPSNPRLSTIHH